MEQQCTLRIADRQAKVQEYAAGHDYGKAESEDDLEVKM